MITSTHQLTQTTIHADDFQNNVYSFPVDSVLKTESVPGKLVISISEGYLLTTSSAGEPKREQNLTYKKQADGQWAVHSVVTIMASERGLLDGMVRIQNAQAGTTILMIQGESTALARIPTPALTVSETVLSFAQTAPGQAKSLVFLVSQAYTDALITITSDAPEYFQLATDKNPNFSASLRIKPSLIGTYVHVRYLSQKAGTHTGQLLIQSDYDEQAVALIGRSTRFLPAARTARSLNRYAQPERRSPATWLKIGVVMASIAVVGGLAWLGFANRHTLSVRESPHKSSKYVIPNENTALMKPDRVESKPVEKSTPAPRKARNDLKEERKVEPSVASTKESTKSVTVDPTANEESKIIARTVEQRPLARKESTAKPTESLVTKQPYRQARPIPAAGESELEKELNQLKPNQP